MSKKECCCNVCQWCDHDHYNINFYSPGNPIFDRPEYVQDQQPNWNSFGTVTTELPSVGHPMTNFNTIWSRCASSGNACCTQPALPVARTVKPNDAFAINYNLRTEPLLLEQTSKLWGSAFLYGDVQPCWFNGLNMTNVYGDDEAFFNFTFELKIEKKVENTYQTVVDIKKTGPGLNLRPHPDTCKSFNVNDSVEWFLRSDCSAFFKEYDQDGNPLPCYRDFAKMPRGPWPYRLQRKLTPEPGNTLCCQNSYGEPYSARDVLIAQKYAYLGTDAPDLSGVVGSIGEFNELIEENILCCPLVPSTCGFGDDPSNCCQDYPYHDKNQLCTQLDISNGTPYGWEDCPSVCPKLSNYSSDPSEMKFFGWINKFNRYTTPEWDIFEGLTSSSSPTGFSGYTGAGRKLSLHVIVPTPFSDFCDPDEIGTQNLSFGEWCFGMDYEAPEAIAALEAAGYVWSNGREDDGVWINKTPTEALRVLFTLDHADLGQGKVWRVFRDWDVTVDKLEKVFYTGTNQQIYDGDSPEVSFRITIKQKVEELQFSSLGCDCPSGYIIDENGKLSPREQACDIHYQTSYFGVVTEEQRELPCWQSHIDGPNSDNIGGRVSFSERGPIAIQTILETDSTGCQLCNSRATGGPVDCDNKFGSRMTPPSGSVNATPRGQVFIVNGPSVSRQNEVLYPSFGSWPQTLNNVPNCVNPYWEGLGGGCIAQPLGDSTQGLYRPPGAAQSVLDQHGFRYSGAVADLPIAGAFTGNVTTMRYRNTYNAVRQSDNSIDLSRLWRWIDGSEVWGSYDMLYGIQDCRWNGAGNCPSSGIPWQDQFKTAFNYAGVWVERWPAAARLGNCWVNCEICGARDNTIIVPAGNTYTPIGPTGPTAYNPGTGDPSGPEDTCPCELGSVPPDANPARYGKWLNPFDRCSINLSRPEGYGAADFHYDCDMILRQGEMGWFCYLEPDFIGYMGIDSDRFYFSNDGQINTFAGLGNPACGAVCSCPTSNTNNANGCRYDVPSPFGGNDSFCDFCPGEETGWSIGFFRNTYFNWRKYLCDQRAKGKKIPTDIMGKLNWQCDGTQIPGNCPPGGNVGIDLECDCDCDFAWSKGACSNLGYGAASYPEGICVNKYLFRGLNPRYKITFEKYDIEQNLGQWCPFETKYEPNPARGNLPFFQNRSHIEITAKGPH